jgi:hypothetical protein
MNNLLMIAATEAKSAAMRCDGDLKAKALAAFAAVRNHWLVLDDDDRFKAGCAGLILALPKGSEDYRRIEIEIETLAALGRAVSGGVFEPPDAMLDGNFEPLGLLKLWREE